MLELNDLELAVFNFLRKICTNFLLDKLNNLSMQAGSWHEIPACLGSQARQTACWGELSTVQSEESVAQFSAGAASSQTLHALLASMMWKRCALGAKQQAL